MESHSAHRKILTTLVRQQAPTISSIIGRSYLSDIKLM